MNQEELYQLIAECRVNNRLAQETIYKHFYKEMFVTCKRYTEDIHDALTILNDGFLKAFTNIAKYSKDLGDFKPWLKTIVINTAIDYTRNQKRGTQLIHIDNIREQGADDSQLNFNHSMEDVAQHLKVLPSVTRVVINLFAFDGYNYKEISEKLGISESTSRWHVSEARKKLRQSMQFKLSKECRI